MSDKVNVLPEPTEDSGLSQDAGQPPVVAENWPVHPPKLGEIFKSNVKTTDPNSSTDAKSDKAGDSKNDKSKETDASQPDETINSA